MKQRIITAAIAIAVFLPVVIYGGYIFVLLTYAMASIGLYELMRMKRIPFLSLPGIVSLLVLWIILLPGGVEETLLKAIGFTKTEVILLAVLLFLTYTVITKNKFNFDDVAFCLLSALYVGIGFFYFIETRDYGLVYVFYSLFVIWATDSGAYFIGRAFGKRKLWPAISPNKTVEGFVGGICCAIVVGILFAVFSSIEGSVAALITISLVLSVFGQIGDLVESAFKRHYGVKDSGNILPGHGGILDRFDSLIFVWPLLNFLLIMKESLF